MVLYSIKVHNADVASAVAELSLFGPQNSVTVKCYSTWTGYRGKENCHPGQEDFPTRKATFNFCLPNEQGLVMLSVGLQNKPETAAVLPVPPASVLHVAMWSLQSQQSACNKQA